MSDTTRPTTGNGQVATVLVVDDEPDVRHVVSLMLRREGYEVLEAGDGEAAVEVVRAARGAVDAVLLDVMMPRMTGHEALPAIRALAPETPVVLFSGYAREEVAEHLDNATVHTSFVPKPFDRTDLLAAIDEAVRASPRRRDAG